MSLFASLKRFDIYRDVPKDLSEQTVTGAIGQTRRQAGGTRAEL